MSKNFSAIMPDKYAKLFKALYERVEALEAKSDEKPKKESKKGAE